MKYEVLKINSKDDLTSMQEWVEQKDIENYLKDYRENAAYEVYHDESCDVYTICMFDVPTYQLRSE